MIQLSGLDTERLGKAILGRRSVIIPGDSEGASGSSTLIGSTVGGSVGTSVFGLLAVAGIVTATVTLTGALGLRVSGQGSVISVGGPKGGYIRAPFNGIFTGWTLLADQAGDISIDIWKDDIANFPPTAADTITGGNKPIMVGAQKATGDVTGWSATFTADDVFAFRVESATTIQGIVLEISTERT